MKDLCRFEYKGKRYVALVRKLTETECFRLMGVEEKDIKTLTGGEIARTSCYKLAGNSIVEDVLFHIFRKLFIEVDNESAQLGLFDKRNEKPNYNRENPLRVVTLCSGYDSQCLALERLKREYPPFDYELVAWSEFDPESSQPLEKQPAVVAHNLLFPQWRDRNLGDMTKIDWTKIDDFDMLFYSTPCLTADMRCLTMDGYKPIVSIRVGEKVLTKGNTWERVVKKFDNGRHQTCYVDVLGVANPIHCTPNHKFYVKRQEEDEPMFVEAKDLKLGDVLLMVRSLNETMRGARWNLLYKDVHYEYHAFLGLRCGKVENVYNMEVENDHSYIVEGVISKNCQSISTAGLQHGFTENSGTRSSIIWNVRDALRIKKPKYACLENVAAMVQSKFLPMFQLWQDEVRKIGYANYAQLLNSKNYNIPQNRERIFLMSVRDDIDNDYHFPEKMKLTRLLEDCLEDTEDEKYFLDPTKVDVFVHKNINMIEKYIDESGGGAD